MPGERGAFGTFGDPGAAARAIRALRDAGLRVEVAMPAPFPEVVAALGRPRSGLGLVTFQGAVAGLLLGVLLTVGTSLAWELVTGGKPIVSWPPFVIVIFELTVLIGSLTNLVAVIVGATRGRRFPVIARTTGDRIGVFAAGEGDRAERILRERGAEEVRRVG